MRVLRLLLYLTPALFLVLAPAAFAVDGVVLINQATAATGLPGCGSTGFPMVICNPGSYRLSGDLSVPANLDGVLITASDVSLDLNGFTISGPSVNVHTGVIAGSSTHRVTVSNGRVIGFANGVVLGGTSSIARQLTVDLIADIGIQVDGVGIVEDCSVNATGTGIMLTGLSGMALGNTVFTASSGSTGAIVFSSSGAGGYGHNTITGNVVGVGAISMGDNVCLDTATRC